MSNQMIVARSFRRCHTASDDPPHPIEDCTRLHMHPADDAPSPLDSCTTKYQHPHPVTPHHHPQRPRSQSIATTIDGVESIIRFLLLPSQVFIVLLLELLNSFRVFGLRFVLYNYITNEFAISDAQAGTLLGIKGFIDVIFGLAGSLLVDIMGVRAVSITALSIAIVGRSLMAFGTTKATLYTALFFFSPCGEAMLSMGLYRVALKKLTTPMTRPLAFALSYAASHLAGAVADLVVDRMRRNVKDWKVDGRMIGLGTFVYTPTRQFIVSVQCVCFFLFYNMHNDIIFVQQ